MLSMTRKQLFLISAAAVVLTLSCYAQRKELKPDDFGVMSTDGVFSAELIQQYDSSAQADKISLPGVSVVLNHVGDYQVIVEITTIVNRVATPRGIRVGDPKGKVLVAYGPGNEKKTEEGQQALAYVFDNYDFGELRELYPFIGSFNMDFIMDKDRVKEIHIYVYYSF